MSYNCCSRNFSSCSLGSYLRYPGSSCGSSYPSSLVYSTNLCSPRPCQLGSSVYRGCQTTRCEPARCQTCRVVSSPCQVSCYRPRTSTLCSPSLSTYSGSVGCGSNRGYSLGCGSRSFCSLGCGTSGFKPLGYGVCGFPSLRYGSRFCCPTYLASKTFQSSCYRPTYRSAFCRSTC
ncbi:keratin-associated protein 13-2-like [Manis pentadactyla]|uniref:keratin-associated protein 13-2-like n=1 Tax=Manis pentadactyla TaxID=143292 RepID=UPI00255CF7F5|nr:keratin-associated protein 13-2-like [Manis pentadactyla]